MIVLTESGPSISSDDIVALESQLRTQLPESYRQFLMKYNGGRPKPDTIQIEGLPGGSTDIQFFFGINDPMDSANVLWNWKSCSGRIPDQLLPIACDSLGSVFCIRLSGNSRGSVVFCLLTFDQDDGTTYFIACDFSEFLGKIVPFETVHISN